MNEVLRRFKGGNFGSLDHVWLNLNADMTEAAIRKAAEVESNFSRGNRNLPVGPFAGIITARSGTTNATYDATTNNLWPYYEVEDAAPVNRLFDTADVTYTASEVGDPCLIYVDWENDDEVSVVALTETITVESCDEGMAMSSWMGF